MIVNDFNVCGPEFSPYEANAPLIIDADAVLTLSIIFQRLKVVAGRGLQEGQCLRRVELRQFAFGDLGEGLEPTWALSFVECLGVSTPERLDHLRSVLRGT